ncbi:hypothetical protein [Flavobacterium subsaxonicum]|uniref:Outer membrane protein beta-barrel domain-containing protein n=1 Tax=Flavobacterium subsaxonicum WB 4.1-42 = DSM 21790 TaxID=1121898 RepID=A0A0A2ML84_9FLAO|nr:hypothetical protein [Flavobacterium subsaxonicum]KGO92208.1 hypothetical protein Q766_13685 [Flavobacterium subsaxonicum WB 4.1-42 = DSM 21790]
MKRIIFYIALVATGLCMPKAYAQFTPVKFEDPLPTAPEERKAELERRLQVKLDQFEKVKQNIIADEKYDLKKAVEKITAQLEEGSITPEQAQALKEEAAKKAALNIDNKVAIVDNQIALAKRDEVYDFNANQGTYFEMGFGNAYDDNGSFLLGFNYNAKNRKKKYDKRTTSDVVLASGFNNTIGDGKTIGDSYRFGKSGFAEIGIALKTRLFKDSYKVRLVYGLSYHFNTLSPKNNKYFVNNDGTTVLEEFPNKLKQSQMRFDNLVVPVHFEFGPSKKREYKDYFRYDTTNMLKVGIGGFAGINTGATQFLKYKAGGERFATRVRTDFNATKFVYGVSGYIGLGSISLYAKYDLNPVFTNSAAKDHNISLALRLDL